MKKRWIFFIAIPITYIALLWLLVELESGAEGATIQTFPQAVWYSLVTVTTVGYGDLYPVTAAGRVISIVFLVISVGLMGLLISVTLDIVRRMRLFLRLSLLSGHKWYIFSGISPDAAVLAENLHRESPDAVVIFIGKNDGHEVPEHTIFINGTVPEIISRRRSREGVRIFCMKEDNAQNYLEAVSLADMGVPICCQAKFVPSHPPENVHFYSRIDCAARLFWQRHPIKSVRETIVLIGFGEVGAAILGRALEINILSVDQQICYHVFGDSGDYLRNHMQLEQFLTLGEQGECGDSLIFHDEPWNGSPALLERADRIVLCADTDTENLEALLVLRKYFITKGNVYIYECDVCGEAVSFGLPQEMLTPSYVMREELSEIARYKHEIYRRSVNNAIAPWEELDSMLQRFNISAADHLSIKVRILLGEDAPELPSDELDQETLRRAAEVYQASDEKTLYRLRRIEQQRCLRFYYLNNWRYGPVMDNNARLHPLLKDFDELDEEDRIRHDQAWELIDQLRKWKEN